MVGISNTTAINITDINQITNSSNLAEFSVKVNWIVFDGWLFFSLLMTAWFILIMAANRKQIARGLEPRLLANTMVSGFPITLASFLFRAVEVYYLGLRKSLLTDYQLWIIPVIMLVIASYLWATREQT